MSQTRIDFQSADAARFNQLRDDWRSVASSCALSRAGLRVATVLPTFVNREYGYAFPTDEDLAGAIGTKNTSTAKRGLISLEDAHLIDRITIPKRDDKGIVIGKTRRIYLTMPEPKVHFGDQPKVQLPKVQTEPKVQKWSTEGSPVCTNIPDNNTPDVFPAYEKKGRLSEGTYTRDAPSVVDPSVVDVEEDRQASPDPVSSRSPEAPASSPSPKPNSYLAMKNGDRVEQPAPPKPSPKPEPSGLWREAKHPKSKQGQPLSRKPFPAPKNELAAQAFFRRHNVPKTEWPRLLPDLMDGYLYEYDIEPWMDLV
ncbi:MAG: hypothetical protein DI589_05805 [Shinella sp.]|nr:MAG: hypothetical protein DI589_05805 [Shinella sp.]